MRVHINKRQSTKPERIFAEILKRNRIPFRFREILDGREIDFIILDKFAVEINGHDQDAQRNAWLVSKGLSPIHYNNSQLYEKREEVEINITNLIDKYVKRQSNRPKCTKD